MKLNFPQVICRWDVSIGKVKGQFHDSHTFASKNVGALFFLQISLLDGSDLLLWIIEWGSKIRLSRLWWLVFVDIQDIQESDNRNRFKNFSKSSFW